MTHTQIPAEVIAKFNSYMTVATSLPRLYRSAGEKAKETRAFNKFIKACEAAGLSYAKVTPILSASWVG